MIVLVSSSLEPLEDEVLEDTQSSERQKEHNPQRPGTSHSSQPLLFLYHETGRSGFSTQANDSQVKGTLDLVMPYLSKVMDIQEV